MASLNDLVALELGSLDLNRGLLTTPDGVRKLTPTESSLMRALITARGERVSALDLLAQVWGYGPKTQTRTLTTTMRRLRMKVEKDPKTPFHLLTNSGGYRFQRLLQAHAADAAMVDADPFIGRAEELAQLDMLESAGARLITLVGAGGIGKTRLATRWLRERPARQVSLVSVQDPATVWELVGAALGYRTSDAKALGLALADSKQWLLLDNLEQLLPGLQGGLQTLLEHCGQTRLLLTTRVRVGVVGETVLPLGPLQPDDALALIRLRAPQASASQSSAGLAQLAARLDRVPLAIELASGRLGLLGLKGLNQALDQSSEVLSRRGDGRQASMQANVAWSWALLSPNEKAAACRLSVFRSPFRSSSAIALLGPSGPELMQSLLEKSWLTASSGDRLCMLEALREYAQEESDEELLAAACQAHLQVFAPLGTPQSIEALVCSPESPQRMLSDEWQDLILALNTAKELGRVEERCTVLLAMGVACRLDRPPRLVLDEALELLQVSKLSPELRISLRLLCSRLQHVAGDSAQARLQAAEARDEAIGLGLHRKVIEALVHLGRGYQQHGDLLTAEARHQEALDLAKREGTALDVATTQVDLADCLHFQGRLQEALSLSLSAEPVLRALGASFSLGSVLGNTGIIWGELGENAKARECLEASVQVHQEAGRIHWAGMMRVNLAYVVLNSGDAARCLELEREAVAALSAPQDRAARGVAWIGAAEAARRLGLRGDAIEAITRAQALLQKHPLLRAVAGSQAAEIAGDAQAARANMASIAEAGSEIETEVARCRLGRVLLRGGDRSSAQACLTQAQGVLQAKGLGPGAPLHFHCEELQLLLAAPIHGSEPMKR